MANVVGTPSMTGNDAEPTAQVTLNGKRNQNVPSAGMGLAWIVLWAEGAGEEVR
jgi:hypothetical protein